MGWCLVGGMSGYHEDAHPHGSKSNLMPSNENVVDTKWEKRIPQRMPI